MNSLWLQHHIITPNAKSNSMQRERPKIYIDIYITSIVTIQTPIPRSLCGVSVCVCVGLWNVRDTADNRNFPLYLILFAWLCVYFVCNKFPPISLYLPNNLSSLHLTSSRSHKSNTRSHNFYVSRACYSYAIVNSYSDPLTLREGIDFNRKTWKQSKLNTQSTRHSCGSPYGINSACSAVALWKRNDSPTDNDDEKEVGKIKKTTSQIKCLSSYIWNMCLYDVALV